MTSKLKNFFASEDGIALLFSLGILSLLLVLALSFASTAIIERKIAERNSESVSARLLAESGLNRIAGFLQYAYPDSVTMYIGTDTDTGMFSYTDSLGRKMHVSDGTDADFIRSLATVVTSPDDSADSFILDEATAATARWKYIRTDENGDGSLDRIIGRIAYFVIDESGKLDPNYVVKSGESEGSESRLGVSTTEIVAPFSDTEVANIVSNHCFSMKQLTKGVLDNSTTQADYNNILTSMFPHSEPDPESYLDSQGVERHRFNLARTDWNSKPVTVNNIIGSPLTYDKADSPCDGSGIPWLSNWSDVVKGTFNSGSDRAKQIAANLIDYCDNDGNSSSIYPNNTGYTFSITTDVADISDDAANPTYTGLEMTPLLNEIGVLAQVDIDVSSSGTPASFTFKYVVTPKLIAECIKFFYAPSDYELPVTFEILEGSLYIEYTTPSGGTGNATIDLDDASKYPSSNRVITIKGSGACSAYESNNGSEVALSSWDSGNIGPSSTSSTAKITNIQLKLRRVKMMYKGIVCDFAKPDSDSSFFSGSQVGGNDIQQSGTGSATYNLWFSYQVADPRQNLNDGDWPVPTIGNNASYNSAGGTAGLKNTSVDPSSGADLESKTDPASNGSLVSSAYIRNAPMQSPWEIGAIHRGAKWETINLTEYNSSTLNPASSIPAYYNDAEDAATNNNGGDANILDQIKMTSDSYTYGKVNVNCPYSNVLVALFQNVKCGGAYGNLGLGSPLDTSKATNISTESASGQKNGVLYTNGSLGGSAFANRGMLAKVPTITDKTVREAIKGSTIDKDAELEELIGKVANLTTVRPNYFTVIVVAQAIKDIGGSGGSDILISKDLNYDGLVGNSQPDNYDANGDGSTSDTIDELNQPTQLNTYNCMFDEILAEQKIKATIYRDAYTGKWKILSYEYLED